MVNEVLEAYENMLDHRVFAEAWGDGQLLTTPFDFRDGEPITLFVRRRESDGLFEVTDRGQASDSLTVADVNLEQRAVRASWSALRDTIEFGIPQDRYTSEWELIVVVPSRDLGEAMRQIGETCVRADGLRAMSGHTRQMSNVRDRLVREALQRDLAVVPSAQVESKFGARRTVTAKVAGKRSSAYIQAVTKQADPWNAADKARSIFMDSNLTDDQKFTLIETGAKLRSEHLKGIEQHSHVILEAEVPDFLGRLAA